MTLTPQQVRDIAAGAEPADVLNEHADRLDAKLADLRWQPNRAHIATARTAMRIAASALTAAHAAGEREGIEKAAQCAEANNAFPIEGEAIAAAIRALVPNGEEDGR